jgi:serine/threonine-protein kinase
LKSYSTNDFRLEYPATWTLDTSKTWGADVMLFAPHENEEDNFSENVNVLIQDLSGMGIGLEQYKEITDDQITTLALDGKILESSIIKTDEKEFYRITYTMTQGDFKLRITSICFIHNEKAFLVTFTSEEDQFEKYKVVGEEILGSFALVK